VQANVRGVRVLAVAPSSAAERVGLHPNADVIVAADGRPVDSPEKLAGVIGKHAGGDTVKLLVLSDAGFRDVAVRLPGGRPR
jgi:S1-C subfamily serine protease